ncbi:hypothetical protein [Umezawaea sp. Da 62-37]|uniref:hypothetical protein n=1 Tax=Umezawaea sp. Da 62-37 TaxID=3075927 RepID=UPI0028F6FBEE|nr:hypothetical protein [Umezawaea sp. Da 62-37]WNV90356.1 hypothetical protein RM788_19370 [Umezawaea sp. Da 62-37]
MARNAALNAKQMAVLRWVSEGCADGVYEGTAHRLVARALHNRKLIVVKGNGSSWTARMTDEGTHYLDHGQPPPAVDHVESSRQTGARPPKTRKQGPVDQLITSLAEAPDRRIFVPPSAAGRQRMLASMARKLERIPAGSRISFGHSQESDGLMVTLTQEPIPDWQARLLDPLYVSHELSDPQG